MNYKKLTVIVALAAVMITGAMSLGVRLKQNYEMEFGVGLEEYTVNGTVKTFDAKAESLPIFEESTQKLLLPLRPVVEGLSGTLKWDAEDKSTTISYKNKNLRIQPNSVQAAFNGYGITLKDAPEIKKGGIYVTPEFFADYFGTDINWDVTKKQIILKTEDVSRPTVSVNTLNHEQNAATYEVDIPVISGLNDASYEKSLNHSLSERGVKEVSDFIGMAKAQHQKDMPPFTLNTSCTIPYRRSELISIISQGKEVTNKGTTTIKKAINIDLQAQKTLVLKDLFKDEKYRKRFAGKINETLTELPPEIENQFYLDEQKQLVLFLKVEETGEFAEYPISLAEYKKLLKPRYYYLENGK